VSFTHTARHHFFQVHMRTEVITIQPITPGDQDWMRTLLNDHWGSVEVVSRGKVQIADRLPGFIAWKAEERAGLITYRVEEDQCEIVTIDSLSPGIGVGSALIDRVIQEARSQNCQRLWLITTNDNLPALHFYQKRGFRLSAVYPNAILVSRKLKPSIPLIGIDGIPICDEIELEIRLK
jgi:ribosomal protein S18 acetylase RimI-like enzyme